VKPVLHDSGTGVRFSRRVGEQAPDTDYAQGWGCVPIVPAKQSPKRAPWWKRAFSNDPTARKQAWL
jgi:hypothetical protein